MKRRMFLAVLAAALCFAGCQAQNPETPTQENSETPAIVETAAEEQPAETATEEQPKAEVSFTAADMKGADAQNPNLLFSDVDFSQVPHFTSGEGMEDYFWDCVNQRCRSIVFSCEKSAMPNLESSRFCEDYLLCWSNVKLEPGEQGIHYIIRVNYYPGENVAWAYLNQDLSQLEEQEVQLYDTAVAWLEENIDDSMSDYDKCVAIHDYLAGNVVYSNELLAGLNSSFTVDWGITAYGAMVDNLSICQGYADAFKMLTTMCGMESRQIFGTGSGEPHNWNLIQLDGNWYHVDCTQDNKFGTDGSSAKVYLFADDAQMRKTHSWDAARYPKAEADSLWWYRQNDAILDAEADLESKVALPMQEGRTVNLYVRNLNKKQVTDYVQSLGGQFHAADYQSDVLLCAWIPAE